MRGALVIRASGDMDFAAPIAQTLQSHELEMVKAELDKTQKKLAKAKADKRKAENAELGVRRAGDTSKYKRKIRRARHKYKVRKPNKVESVLLVGWALIWLGIFAAADKLQAWNRSK